MTRRPGLSLTEVLVALFIMGIGTIAILTLFPLGALNMAQAFRDDRTTQAAAQADSFLRWYIQDKKDANPQQLYPDPVNKIPGEPWIPLMDDPGSKTLSRYLIPVTGQSVPSYPVVIDPMGNVARGGGVAGGGRAVWVGDNGFGDGSPAYKNTTAIPRQTLALVNQLVPAANQPPFALRLCTLLDGFGYDKASGAPDTTSGAVERDIRYNWLWVVQRPDNSIRSAATMTVVVFDKRAPNYAPAGSETVYSPTFAQPGQSRLSFSAGQVPPVQKGGWLLDATVVAADATGTKFNVPALSDGGGTAPAGTQAWIRNANFYRVVSITDLGTAGADIELELPLKVDLIPPPPNPPIAGYAPTVPLPAQFRRFIYLNGVAEVFERRVSLDL